MGYPPEVIFRALFIIMFFQFQCKMYFLFIGFTGIIITDDLSMKATSSIKNATIKALLAGNDIVMTADYKQGFNDIKDAVEDGTISENLIDNIVHRILSWKYYKGLMYEKTK